MTLRAQTQESSANQDSWRKYPRIAMSLAQEIIGGSLNFARAIWHNSLAAIAKFLPMNRGDRHQQKFLQLARKIRAASDPKEIWQPAADALGEIFQLSRCIICSFAEESEKVLVVAEYCQYSCTSMLGKLLALMEEPTLIQAVASLEPVAIAINGTEDQFERTAVLTVPIYYQDRVSGLISLHYCNNSKISSPPWQAAEIELVQDIAEEIARTMAISQLHKQLEAADRKAQEADILRDEFLRKISHELRTPMNKIMCSLGIVLDEYEEDPEGNKEFIAYAYHTAINLAKMIEDILTIRKLANQNIKIDLSAVNLNDLLNDVDKCMRLQVQEKQLDLLIQTPTYNPIILYSNYRSLLQVFLNVLNNSTKFTNSGGGITISTKVIIKPTIVRHREMPGMVEISITDTGIGVALEKQNRIFNVFSTVEGARFSPEGGPGNGLALCQRLVEAMNGEISFFSDGEGLGSTVTFTAPLYRVPNPVADNQVTS